MKIAKSRSYEIDGSNVSFEFDREDGKIIGVKKQNNNGDFISVDPKTSEFGDLSQSDEAVNAYNVAKYSSNKRAYVDSVASKTSSELESYYQDQNKKETNDSSLSQKKPLLLISPYCRCRSSEIFFFYVWVFLFLFVVLGCTFVLRERPFFSGSSHPQDQTIFSHNGSLPRHLDQNSALGI